MTATVAPAAAEKLAVGRVIVLGAEAIAADWPMPVGLALPLEVVPRLFVS